MPGRVDFHCHILPGADHGSDGIVTSLAQLNLQKSAGIGKIVATPHFYPQKVTIGHFLESREACAGYLLKHLPPDAPEIFLAAEVLICEGMEEMRDLARLCVAGTDVLLLEMPFRRFEDRLFLTVERLCSRGDLRVLLAHVDRYNADDIAALIDLGATAQINAYALASFGTRLRMRRFTDGDCVSAFGSDLHMANEKSMKRYEKGLKKIGQSLENEINRKAEELLAGAIPLTALK